MNMNLKDYGTVDLKRIYVRRSEAKEFIPNNEGVVKKFEEFILDTEGTNLKYILNLPYLVFLSLTCMSV